MTAGNAEHVVADRLTIGEVVSLLHDTYPDVTQSSLRYFEREGLLSAGRTHGGHRLYSFDDVERIRRIKAWQAENHSIQSIRHRLIELDGPETIPRLQQRVISLTLSGDLVDAQQAILHADDIGIGLDRLFDDVVISMIETVTERRKSGTLLVAQEREIFDGIRQVIGILAARHIAPSYPGPTVVAACVEGETHDLGLRMACSLLCQKGVRIHQLGPDVAPNVLVEAVGLYRPDAVLLSILDENGLPSVFAAMDALRSEIPTPDMPMVFVGGADIQHCVDRIRAAGAVVPGGASFHDGVASMISHMAAKRGRPDLSEQDPVTDAGARSPDRHIDSADSAPGR